MIELLKLNNGQLRLIIQDIYFQLITRRFEKIKFYTVVQLGKQVLFIHRNCIISLVHSIDLAAHATRTNMIIPQSTYDIANTVYKKNT